MKNKSIFVLVCLFMLFTVLFFYMSNVFIPINFKNFVLTKLEEAFQREISLEKISYLPYKGFIIHDLRIYQKDNPKKTFIRIDEVSFNIILASVIKEQKVIIPSLHIVKPFVHIIRSRNGEWNFNDLIAKNSSGSKIPDLLLRKLVIEKGSVDFIDRSQKEEFIEPLRDIKIEAIASIDKKIKFELKADIPRKKSKTKLDGNYDLSEKTLEAHIITNNIPLSEYISLFNKKTGLESGIVDTAELNAEFNGKKMHVSGSIVINGAAFKLNDGRKFTGDLTVSNSQWSFEKNNLSGLGEFMVPAFQMSKIRSDSVSGELSGNITSLNVTSDSITALGNIVLDDAIITLPKNRSLRGNLILQDANLSSGQEGILLTGQAHAKNSSCILNKKQKFEGSISSQKFSLKVKKGNIDISGDLQAKDLNAVLSKNNTVKGGISAPKFDLSYGPDGIKMHVRAQTEALNFTSGEKWHFSGDPLIKADYAYLNEKEAHQYSGSVDVANAILEGIPFLEKAEHLKGKVDFETDACSTSSLTFKSKDTLLKLSGRMSNFNNLKINAELASDAVDLNNAATLFPDVFEGSGIDLSGESSLRASFRGRLRLPKDANVRIAGRVKQAAVNSEELGKNIENVSADLEYLNNTLNWKDLKATFGGVSYSSEGNLNNFNRPVVQMSLSSKDINLITEFKILNRAFKINTIDGEYLASNFTAEGEVHIPEGQEPLIDLKGTVSLNMEDLPLIAPASKRWINKLEPIGFLSLRGLYKGHPKDWRNWKLTFESEAPSLQIRGYPLTNVTFNYGQRDKKISECNLAAEIYKGSLAVNSSVDLTGNDFASQIDLSLSGLDLAELRDDGKVNSRHLKGILSLAANIDGPAIDKRKMSGSGNLAIVDGHILQWNILKGLASALLIKEYKHFVFTDASADFNIERGKAFTKNFEMLGNQINIKGKGWIDINKNLSFDIIPKFSEIVLVQSESMRKLPTSFLTQTDGYITIKLTGSLDDPKYHVDTSPFKVIEKTGEILIDSVGSILEGLF